MSNIVSLEAAAQRRRQTLANLADMHPSLRWLAGEDQTQAHRRGEPGRTACGETGPLRLAPGRVPLCDRCYPRAG
uniref:hypothetical protein n=1 Tax=Nonomuraea sp. CA-251285 TaxID=3240002 RepID=UPI003F496502